MIRLPRRIATVLVPGAALSGVGAAQARGGYDVLIRGCTVVDGTGAPRFKAGVALRGDRIVAIGPGLIPSDGVVVVDAVPRVRITTGAFADLVIFDARPDSGPGDVHRPGSIPGRDRSPVHQRRPVIRLGALTGELPSRVIKGPARAQIPAYHE